MQAMSCKLTHPHPSGQTDDRASNQRFVALQITFVYH